MDTILVPGVSVSICVHLLDIGRTHYKTLWHFFILWWSAFTACVLRPAVARTVAIFGVMNSVIHTAHPPAGLQARGVCVCVCVCVCVFVCMRVSGEPLGERQGSHCPQQPWGRVWPSRTRVLGHSQTSRWLPLTLCPILLTSMPLHSHWSTPTSLKPSRPRSLILFFL